MSDELIKPGEPVTLEQVRAYEAHFRVLENDILLARAAFMRQAGVTFNGQRDEYEILGYDRIITNKQYRDEYARGGIAGRVVDVMPDACWRGEPAMELVENDDPKTDTEFEKAWKALDTKHQICAKLQRVDRLARLSTYGVLLIGDGGPLDQPLTKSSPDKLLYLMPFSGGGGPSMNADARMLSIDASCTIAEYEIDSTNERFGLPKTYQLKRTDFSSPDFQRPVHWTRIIHVAEGLLEDDVFGTPALERIWNLLIDLRKVTGGGAEAFWLRANQGLHFDIDKDLALQDGGVSEALAKLKEDAEKYKHQLQRWIRTRGVKVETLGSDVANFANPADAIITQIAGSKAIPKRILTGSEMGELASSQDRENFKDQVNGRQTQYCAPIIVRQLADRFIEFGFLPSPKGGVNAYQVRWPHIQTLTEDERAKGAQMWAGTTTGGDPVFTDAEIRDKWYGMEPLTKEQLDEMARRKEEKLKQQQAFAPKPAFPRAAEENSDDELVRVLADAIEVGDRELIDRILGGPGSGNFNHEGRPGQVGGSSGEGSGSSGEGTITRDGETDNYRLIVDGVSKGRVKSVMRNIAPMIGAPRSMAKVWGAKQGPYGQTVEFATQEEAEDYLRSLGGAGSGNFGHAGRPGEVGGSASGSWPIADDVVRTLGAHYPDEVNRASQAWRDGLSDSQLRTIKIWQNGSKRINAPLWGLGDGTPEVQAQIRDLHDALSQAPTAPPPELVWRLVETKRLPALHEGDEIELKGFQSTTLQPAYLTSLADQPNRRVLEIKPSRGAYLGTAGLYPTQYEYLLPHASRFKVVGEKNVKMRMIDPNTGRDRTINRVVTQLEML